MPRGDSIARSAPFGPASALGPHVVISGGVRNSYALATRERLGAAVNW